MRRRKRRIVVMIMMTVMMNNKSLSSLDLSHNNLAQMVGVHLAAALVRITLLVTTVMTRIVMRMMMRWRRRIINNMSLSPLDLFHNSLA